jgi:hypothetical protein
LLPGLSKTLQKVLREKFLAKNIAGKEDIACRDNVPFDTLPAEAGQILGSSSQLV